MAARWLWLGEDESSDEVRLWPLTTVTPILMGPPRLYAEALAFALKAVQELLGWALRHTFNPCTDVCLLLQTDQRCRMVFLRFLRLSEELDVLVFIDVVRKLAA
eukprot:1700877-Amphidinium_carterae.1